MSKLAAFGFLTPFLPVGAAQQVDAQGPDILPLALVTMGAIFAAAAIGLLLYLLRRRIGFWLHRPPASNPDEEEGQH